MDVRIVPVRHSFLGWTVIRGVLVDSVSNIQTNGGMSVVWRRGKIVVVVVVGCRHHHDQQPCSSIDKWQILRSLALNVVDDECFSCLHSFDDVVCVPLLLWQILRSLALNVVNDECFSCLHSFDDVVCVPLLLWQKRYIQSRFRTRMHEDDTVKTI